MKKRFLAMVLAAAMMLTAMVGCGNGNTQDGGNANNAGATGDTIKIGGLAPLTGDVSVYGVAVDNGVKMAVEEINADGGVLGKQIEYIVYDEKGDATEAVNAYNKLVQSDNVVAIVGDVTSKPTLAGCAAGGKGQDPADHGQRHGGKHHPGGRKYFPRLLYRPVPGGTDGFLCLQETGEKDCSHHL